MGNQTSTTGNALDVSSLRSGCERIRHNNNTSHPVRLLIFQIAQYPNFDLIYTKLSTFVTCRILFLNDKF